MLSSTPTTSGWPSGTNAATSRPSKILEPCRPDHAPRDRNRWNRLKPLSDAPSTARRAAQTVRWFRHSNAPVASATAFNQVGCVNSTANGASQVSIARAFPGCAIFATIGFPMRQTHGKLRSCLQNLQISAQAADYGDTTEQPGKPPKSSLYQAALAPTGMRTGLVGRPRAESVRYQPAFRPARVSSYAGWYYIPVFLGNPDIPVGPM